MKNAAIVVLLALVVFLCAAKRQPALTIYGTEVHEIQFVAPLQATCFANGRCTVSYVPLPETSK